MKVVSNFPEKVNGATTIEFLKNVKEAYPEASMINVILDQLGYHRSQVVREFAEASSIELHYLPPYSPNLNLIKRLWKVMNAMVRNNPIFKSAKEFRRVLLILLM